jgi:CubicO group peptidase (beta-lactamase class C family)
LIAFAAVLLLARAESFAASGPTPETLRAAAEYSRARRGESLLVIQNDKVIFEQYANGGSAGMRHKIYSGTKSFWAVAAMVAVQERILDLDERVADTITEWRADPRRSRITMREMLNFTDGLDPVFHLHADGLPDRNSLALAAPMVAAPGDAFLYGPSHLQIFCEVLRRKLRAHRQTPFGYLRRRVLDPLGLGAVEHKEDSLGNPLMATGFKLTARQWARFGHMVLHGGKYGSRVIVPENLLDRCFRGTDANPSFGIGFWNNSEGGRGGREVDIENMLELKWHQQNWNRVCICRDAPRDMIVSLGSSYQRLYIIPSLDLIVVRQGKDANFSDGNFLRTLLGR